MFHFLLISLFFLVAKEIEFLIRFLDQDTGNWDLKRTINKEAERAIEFVFRKNI